MQPLFESNGPTLEVEQEMMVKVGRNKGDMSGMDLINSVRLILEIPSICDKVGRRSCGISVHLVAEVIDYAVPPNWYLCLGRIVSREGTIFTPEIGAGLWSSVTTNMPNSVVLFKPRGYMIYGPSR
jgi:hypothetical protein